MYFAVVYRDKAESLALRKRTRAQHLSYLEPFHELILFAGPLLTIKDNTPNGGLIVIDMPDYDSVHDFVQGDPYTIAGVFETIDIAPWQQVIPAKSL